MKWSNNLEGSFEGLSKTFLNIIAIDELWVFHYNRTAK